MKKIVAAFTFILFVMLAGTAFSSNSKIEVIDHHVDARTVKNGMGGKTSATTLTLVYCVDGEAFLSQHRPGTQSSTVLIPLNKKCDEYKSQ